jgi:glycosyltransferase involved in cell wall biosynthesis
MCFARRKEEHLARLLFINRRFELGGAERQLIELTKALDKTEFEICVMTFYEGGGLHHILKTIPGLKLANLRKQGRWDIGRFLWRSWRTASAFRPDVVIGHMRVANLVALVLGKLNGAKVVWAVRDSNTDMPNDDWLSRAAHRLECHLARWTDLVIFNSKAGLEHYVANGFPRTASVVIPNGIDVDRFRPDSEARRRVRRKWQLPDTQPVVGMIARMDPIKDHQTFLEAAAKLAQLRSDVRFACIGDGAPDSRARLIRMTRDLGLSGKVIWETGCENISDTYCAFDVMSLSSRSEGFPNVIAEAMACGVPCVVTDVGDCRQVVGNAGIIVAPGNAAEMAEKWKEMLDTLPHRGEAMARACRERIVASFSSTTLAARTQSALKNLIDPIS